MAYIYRLWLTKRPEVSYIGCCYHIESRIDRHIGCLKNNCHHSRLLQEAYNMLKDTDVKYEVLTECEKSEMYKIEKEYMIGYDKHELYNIVRTGGRFGDALTNNPNRDEIIRNISIGGRARYSNMSDSEREKLSESMSGENNPNWRGGFEQYRKDCPVCHVNRIRLEANTCSECRDRTGSNNSFFGRTHSEKTRKQISQKNKGKLPANTRPVVIDNVEYRSLSEASRKLGIHITTILHRTNNPKKDNYQFI